MHVSISTNLLAALLLVAALPACLTGTESPEIAQPGNNGNNGAGDTGTNNGPGDTGTNNGGGDTGTNNGAGDTGTNNGGADVQPDAPTCDDGEHWDPNTTSCVPDASCPANEHDGGDGTCVPDGTCSLGYHDGGDGTCVAEASCSDGYHNGGAGNCMPLNVCSLGYRDGGAGQCVAEGTCSDGYHNGGLGACLPVGDCAANFHDGGDGVCLSAGNCSAQYADGGDGTCVPEGNCADGYHDGGEGACLTAGTCSAGYHDGGDGSCVLLTACAEGYHDGGAGDCLPLGECIEGYHDGGAGTCVVASTCVSGSVFAWTDNDHDGYGAGATVGCRPTPLPTDLADNATDCDDAKATAWMLSTVYPDRDQDGYTGSAEQGCIGDVLPDDLFLTRHGPPIISFAPTLVGTGMLRRWSSPLNARLPDGRFTECTDSDPACGPLVFGDFGFVVPSRAEITGVRVTVHREGGAVLANSDLVDDGVYLFHQQRAISADKSLRTPWASRRGGEVVTYGGPTDLWEARLTPTMVNDIGFGVSLDVKDPSPGLNPDDARVYHVMMEVFTDGGNDCDDANSHVWGYAGLYTDTDGDFFGAGERMAVCVGQPEGTEANLPDSLGPLPGDCYDANSAANPIASGFVPTDRGDGSFDYDCDGMMTPQPITHVLTCVVESNMCAASTTETWSTIPPLAACGAMSRPNVCTTTTTPCRTVLSSVPTACR